MVERLRRVFSSATYSIVKVRSPAESIHFPQVLLETSSYKPSKLSKGVGTYKSGASNTRQWHFEKFPLGTLSKVMWKSYYVFCVFKRFLCCLTHKCVLRAGKFGEWHRRNAKHTLNNSPISSPWTFIFPLRDHAIWQKVRHSGLFGVTVIRRINS